MCFRETDNVAPSQIEAAVHRHFDWLCHEEGMVREPLAAYGGAWVVCYQGRHAFVTVSLDPESDEWHVMVFPARHGRSYLPAWVSPPTVCTAGLLELFGEPPQSAVQENSHPWDVQLALASALLSLHARRCIAGDFRGWSDLVPSDTRELLHPAMARDYARDGLPQAPPEAVRTLRLHISRLWRPWTPRTLLFASLVLAGMVGALVFVQSQPTLGPFLQRGTPGFYMFGVALIVEGAAILLLIAQAMLRGCGWSWLVERFPRRFPLPTGQSMHNANLSLGRGSLGPTVSWQEDAQYLYLWCSDHRVAWLVPQAAIPWTEIDFEPRDYKSRWWRATIAGRRVKFDPAMLETEAIRRERFEAALRS